MSFNKLVYPYSGYPEAKIRIVNTKSGSSTFSPIPINTDYQEASSCLVKPDGDIIVIATKGANPTTMPNMIVYDSNGNVKNKYYCALNGVSHYYSLLDKEGYVWVLHSNPNIMYITRISPLGVVVTDISINTSSASCILDSKNNLWVITYSGSSSYLMCYSPAGVKIVSDMYLSSNNEYFFGFYKDYVYYCHWNASGHYCISSVNINTNATTEIYDFNSHGYTVNSGYARSIIDSDGVIIIKAYQQSDSKYGVLKFKNGVVEFVPSISPNINPFCVDGDGSVYYMAFGYADGNSYQVYKDVMFASPAPFSITTTPQSKLYEGDVTGMNSALTFGYKVGSSVLSKSPLKPHIYSPNQIESYMGV